MVLASVVCRPAGHKITIPMVPQKIIQKNMYRSVEEVHIMMTSSRCLSTRDLKILICFRVSVKFSKIPDHKYTVVSSFGNDLLQCVCQFF